MSISQNKYPETVALIGKGDPFFTAVGLAALTPEKLGDQDHATHVEVQNASPDAVPIPVAINHPHPVEA